MFNKKDIQKKLKNKFNKKQNYQQILNNLENKKENIFFKYSLIPICLVVIIISITFDIKDYEIPLYSNYSKTSNGTKKSTTTTSKSNIIINKLKSISAASLDAKARYDVEVNVQETFSEHDFIDQIAIPEDMKLSSKYLLYTKDYTKKDTKNTYDILHDYVLWYEKEINNMVEKKVIISFSENFEPLRDYLIDKSNLKSSTINNTEVTISSYNEMYLITFSYNNLNFDIETKNITEDELIELLESIIIGG